MSKPRTSLDGGLLIVMTGPSGCGKSTLLAELMVRDSRLALSVSHTTRAPRAREQNGVHYHFIDAEAFETMVAEGAFAEWARVHDRCYGTSRAEITRLRQDGRDIIFDIDVQGADQLRAAYPDAISVFILPPTMAALEGRLRGRRTESPEQLELRLDNARREISRADDFDYIIVNDQLLDAVADFRAIIQAERRRGTRVRHITRRLLEEAAQEHIEKDTQ